MKGKLNLADLLPVFGIVVDVAALILGLLAFRKTWEILAAARPNLSRRQLFFCGLAALLVALGAGAALKALLGANGD